MLEEFRPASAPRDAAAMGAEGGVRPASVRRSASMSSVGDVEDFRVDLLRQQLEEKDAELSSLQKQLVISRMHLCSLPTSLILIIVYLYPIDYHVSTHLLQ